MPHARIASLRHPDSTHPAAHLLPWLCVLLLAATVSRVDAQTQADDFLYGTWEFIPELSVFLNTAPPQRQTRVYSRHADGVEARIVTVNANGVRQESSYVAPYDSQPHPVYGTPNSDTVSFTRINPYTSIATFTHAGLEAATSERTISYNGQEMTITLRKEGEVVSKWIYRKVAE